MRHSEQSTSALPTIRATTPDSTGTYKYLALIGAGRDGWLVENSDLNRSLGSQLRTIRRSRGLTQEQLAEQLGVTPRYLAGVERAERNLSLKSVNDIASQLGVTPRLTLDGATAST